MVKTTVFTAIYIIYVCIYVPRGLVCSPDLNVCEFAITAMVEVILVHGDGIVYQNQPGKL